MDLGGDVEESVNQLGKLTEIFKLKQEFGTEQALLKVGSAINSLGAASTANEGYMVEFAKRVAGVAPQADISIQKVLGLAATLDQLGQTSEVSSTVFAAVIPDMFKDTGKYAQIAGMGVDEFAKLLKVDANQAFIAFLNGLNGNNAGLGEMATKLDGLGLEGKRSISVLGVLAANTDLLRQQQQLANVEFARGTSLTQEYNTKNNNAQAELDQTLGTTLESWDISLND
ncbi:MAG: phage tail tape measure protein [Chloroflexia bacterium]|nr:phage tail tape measure protein [Chloroflexia bacterium]